MSRIAIVDDSRLVRTFAASVLRAKGHVTIEVDPTSLAEVLTILREQAPDLVMVDLLMPECPGEGLVAACRSDAKLQELPILIVSAHRDEEILVRLQQMGLSGFLLKPLNPAALADKVGEILAS
jgi:two-component system chemotaxis response regulator CheY